MQNPRTATPDQSIWRDIPEDTFREHLVALEERTNAIPVRPQVFPILAHSLRLSEKARSLPLVVEQQLADDLAYIAAVGEGAQSVSAVCVEEQLAGQSLCFRVAAIDAIGEQIQQSLQEVGSILMQTATASDDAETASYVDSLLRLIVQQHFQKLLGRLRSSKWQKPKYLSRTHKKPLWQDFDNLLHRVQFIYPKRGDTRKPATEAHIQILATTVKDFETVSAETDGEFISMLGTIEASYLFCELPESKDFASELESLQDPTPQIAAAVKTLRQIEKIGAYKRIALDMINTAKEYPTLFRDVEFRYIYPYSSINTNIGYESWAKTMHVHAEVQLAVYYDTLHMQEEICSNIQKASHPPRVIGTSKYLCFLCYLFLKHHGSFLVSNTHGRLYDQWTVPDRSDYNEATIELYRNIIGDMDGQITEITNDLGTKEGKRDAWRVEPMTSRQNLLMDSGAQI